MQINICGAVEVFQPQLFKPAFILGTDIIQPKEHYFILFYGQTMIRVFTQGYGLQHQHATWTLNIHDRFFSHAKDFLAFQQVCSLSLTRT